MESIYEALSHALETDELVAQATVLDGWLIGNKMLIWPDGKIIGSLGSERLDQLALQETKALLGGQDSKKIKLPGDQGEVSIFIQVYPPSPRMIIVGAVHIAVPLTDLGKAMGFRTIIVDARSAFATRERFPKVDEIIVDWPSEALQRLHLDEGAYVAILSHDAKFDIPALQVAVESKAKYVGVLASKGTYQVLYDALLENGVPESLLQKVHTPIGIKKLGSRGPEGIAFSIMAEMIAVMRGVQLS